MLFDALSGQTDVNVSAPLYLIIAFIGFDAKKYKEINESVLLFCFVEEFLLKSHRN